MGWSGIFEQRLEAGAVGHANSREKSTSGREHWRAKKPRVEVLEMFVKNEGASVSAVACGGEKAIKNEVREVTGILIIQDLLKDHYKDFGFYSEKSGLIRGVT